MTWIGLGFGLSFSGSGNIFLIYKDIFLSHLTGSIHRLNYCPRVEHLDFHSNFV